MEPKEIADSFFKRYPNIQWSGHGGGSWRSKTTNIKEIPKKREKQHEKFNIHFDFGSDKPCFSMWPVKSWVCQVQEVMRKVMSKDVRETRKHETFSKLPRGLEQLCERGSTRIN